MPAITDLPMISFPIDDLLFELRLKASRGSVLKRRTSELSNFCFDRISDFGEYDASDVESPE